MAPNLNNCISMGSINMLGRPMIALSMISSWSVTLKHSHSSLRFTRSTTPAPRNLSLVVLSTNTWNQKKPTMKRLKTSGELWNLKSQKMRSAVVRKERERQSDLRRLKAEEIHHILIQATTLATITWMIWTTTACLTRASPLSIRSARPKNSTSTSTSRLARKSIESRCLGTRTAAKSVRTLPRRTSFHVSCKLN